jgi:hypothetical protein
MILHDGRTCLSSDDDARPDAIHVAAFTNDAAEPRAANPVVRALREAASV